MQPAAKHQTCAVRFRKITDKRKGIDYLIDSCKLLAEKHPELKENSVSLFSARNRNNWPTYCLSRSIHWILSATSIN